MTLSDAMHSVTPENIQSTDDQYIQTLYYNEHRLFGRKLITVLLRYRDAVILLSVNHINGGLWGDQLW